MTAFATRPIDNAEHFAERWAAAVAGRDVGPFLSATWILGRLRTAPAEAQPFAIYKDEQPVGLYFQRRDAGASLYLYETGDRDADAVYPEDVDLLTDEADRVAAVGLLFAGKPSKVRIRAAVEGLVAAAEQAADEAGYFVRVLDRKESYVIDLEAVRAGGGDVLSGLSSGARQQIRRSERLLAGDGAVTFRRAETQAEEKDAWEKLAELHDAAHAERTGGAFGNEKFLAFHAALRENARARPEWGLDYALETVSANGEAVGVLYQLLWRGTVFNYQTGFKPFDDNRIKRGLLAHVLSAEAQLAAGGKAYDLLAGEGGYKSRLASPTRRLASLEFERKTIGATGRRIARMAKRWIEKHN